METGAQLFNSRIATLGRRDEADFVSLLRRLDQPSRVGRFGAATNDTALAAHARRALANADWIAAAFIDSGLCACVEIYKLGSQAPDVAEAAFVVDPRWRRLGIATALLRTSIAWARGSGIDMLRMVFSRSNWAMRKLVDKGTANFTVSEEEVSADLSVAGGVRIVRSGGHPWIATEVVDCLLARGFVDIEALPPGVAGSPVAFVIGKRP